MTTRPSKLALAAPALVVLGLTGGAPARAQVATDGTVGPRVELAGPEFAIGADLGRQAGRNLFHSFERFSLATGERATFSGSDQVQNVISRVTGGAPSAIDGTIRSTIAGADFYFINPAGVLFGPNASLDVPGSFHISTADELRFADGATFSATNPTANSFTVAAPEAFGFLGPAPAPILVDRSMLAVPPGEALSLVGGDVTIDGGNNGVVSGGGQGLLLAEAGQITLAAAGGPGEVQPASGATSVEDAADVTLVNQAALITAGDGGGTIRIRGGNLVVADQSVVFVDNDGPSDGVGGIDVEADRVRITGGSALATNVFGAGRGGDLRVDAAELRLDQGAIVSRALPGSSGNAGTVQVTARSVEILEASGIISNTFSVGDAGTVRVAADHLLIDGGTSATFAGIASSAEPGSAGDAGRVQIAAGAVEIRSGGAISSATFGQGSAGTIAIETGRLLLSGDGSAFSTQITSSAEPGSSGAAGAVEIGAGEVEILAGGIIASATFTDRDAGTVTIEADRLLLRGGGSELVTGILSSAEAGSGNAGVVRIVAGDLEIRAGSEIRSGTSSDGDGGTVMIEVDHLLIQGDDSAFFTGISSSTNRGASGDGGIVQIAAGALEVLVGGEIRSATFSSGDAGRVAIEADRLLVQGGVISTGTQPGSSGTAGTVAIVARRLEVLDGGQISSVTFAEGNAGTVQVEVGRLLIRGGGSARSTGISSTAGTSQLGDVGQGDAGRVLIQAQSVEIVDGGDLSSSADGPGAAGDVILRAADRLILDQATIATATTAAGGGEIQLQVGDLIDLHDSAVTTSVAGGADPTAGSILIDPKALVIDGSRIQANAPAGFGGTVTIVADNILVPGGDFEALLARGDISATGGDPSRAGTVAVNAPVINLAGDLVILETPFLDAAALLGEPCGVRRDIGTSSFTAAGRGGLATGPDALLTSAYEGSAAAAAGARGPMLVFGGCVSAP